jgi:uncharacterized protein affecting Mg2+/Co2+ transport
MRQEQEVYDDDQPQIEYYVPEETDYPSFDKSGLTDNAIGLIQEYVSVHGILDLTPEQVAEGMEDFMGNPSPPGSLEIAAMVLDVWMMRNPHLVAAPYEGEDGAYEGEEGAYEGEEGVIDEHGFTGSSEEQAAAALIQNQWRSRGPVVQEDEYGFTGSAEEQAAAAKIQNKWRTRAPEQEEPHEDEYGFTGSTEEQDAAAMIQSQWRSRQPVVQEDEYGFTGSAEEQNAAARIQNKWRSRQPVVEEDDYGFTGSAEEQAAAAKIQSKWRSRDPGVIEAEEDDYGFTGSAEEQGAAAKIQNRWRDRQAQSSQDQYIEPAAEDQFGFTGSAEESAAASKIQNNWRSRGQEESKEEDEYVVVEKEDCGEAAFAQEVAALMVPLGCEVEPNVHPTEGPVVRMRLVDTGSTLYKSDVEPGDIITCMNGLPLTSINQLYTLLNRVVPGDKFTWSIKRISLTGYVKEWSVCLIMPTKPVSWTKLMSPGLPPAIPYRSHSGLLPNDAGFIEKYGEVPAYFVQVPKRVETREQARVEVVEVAPLPPPPPPVIVAPPEPGTHVVEYVKADPAQYTAVVDSLVSKHNSLARGTKVDTVEYVDVASSLYPTATQTVRTATPVTTTAVTASRYQSSAAAALDAADGVMDGRYYGRPIVEASGARTSRTITPVTTTAVTAQRYQGSAAAALDAADGVMDGRYYGRPIVEANGARSGVSTTRTTLSGAVATTSPTIPAPVTITADSYVSSPVGSSAPVVSSGPVVTRTTLAGQTVPATSSVSSGVAISRTPAVSTIRSASPILTTSSPSDLAVTAVRQGQDHSAYVQARLRALGQC